MNIYLDLDTHSWGLNDFTDENSLAITGTVYSDRELTTAFDLTGYTLTFRFIEQGSLLIDNDRDIETVTAASGTWRFKPSASTFATEGVGQVVIRLEKTGTRISAVGLNGSADLHVELV